MDLPRYEKIWLWFGIATLAAFLLITGVMAFGMNLHPADGHMKTVAPEHVRETAPFDSPGVFQIGANEYKAVLLAQTFAFSPNETVVPAGATVHFQASSPDVVHGIAVPGTNVNMMVVPGHITEFTYTFKKPGEYLMLCNEYCGAGHQLMMGKLIVK
ncbi:cytochrome c oxidase subunit II [Brevibacillus fluminis]|uniref:cytochrome c oxidase subunit II n=1 Tax=Brevibacillus fluminis TaxID=511487 RepID=UPI003F88F96B